MAHLKYGISFIVLACWLVSCSSIPHPESYPLNTQQKMQAAHHWDVLANNIANQVNTTLIDQGYLQTPVFVKHTCGDANPCGGSSITPFDEGFNDLLTTQLVAFGVPTLASEDPSGLIVEYKVQVIYHEDQEIKVLWPGALTMLTMGIIVLQNAPWEIQAFTGAAVMDVARQSKVVNGNYEVIISVSIIDDNRYLMRNSSIFYINDANFWHYQYTGSAAEVALTNSRAESVEATDPFSKPQTPVNEHVETNPYHYLPVAPLRVQ